MPRTGLPRRQALALLLAAVMLIPAAQAGHWTLRTSFEPVDGPVVLDEVLDVEKLRDKLAEKTADSDLRVEMTTRTTTWLGDKERDALYRLETVDAGFELLEGSDGSASYHVQAHAPTYQDILNVDEDRRIFYIACALKDDRITWDAASRTEQIQLNQAIDSFDVDESDCRLSAGDEVEFRGLTGTAEISRQRGPDRVEFEATMTTSAGEEVGTLTFNKYRAPIGWADTVAEHLKDPEDEETEKDEQEDDETETQGSGSTLVTSNSQELKNNADETTNDDSPPVDAEAVRGIVADFHQNWWGCLKVSPRLDQNLSRARSQMEDGEPVSYVRLDIDRIEDCFKSRSWNTVSDEDTEGLGSVLGLLTARCNDEIIKKMANSVMPPYPSLFIHWLGEAEALGMMDEDTLVIDLGDDIDCATSTVGDHL